jgi:hypothetical protein
VVFSGRVAWDGLEETAFMSLQPSFAFPIDVVRRAELFALIADLVRSEGAEAPTASPKPLDEPRISVLDRRLFVNGQAFDLARRPLMMRLFQELVAAPGGWIDRDQLLTRVYGLRDGARSPRYVAATVNNAVKLISRARAATGTFFAAAAGAGYEWLPYDADRKAWKLVRPRP